MIADSLKNYKLYLSINEGFEKAFGFIHQFLEKELPDGRYDIDGDRVYAMVQSYETIPESEAKWETHNLYIDLQYVAAGNEIIGWTNVKNLIPCVMYNSEKDYTLYEEKEGTPVKLKDGDFTILFPEDAHKPKCIWGKSQAIKKIVVKIKL
jgi:biofilm protein TabA